MLTRERLIEVLSYCPVTGDFRWVKRTSNRIKPGDLAGKVSDRGYRWIMVDRRRYSAQRLAWLAVIGAWPEGVIDHIDGDPANNAFENLRDVPQQVNCRNLKARKTNRSGHPGVSWLSARKKWYASIMIDGRTRNLGTYPTLAEAIQARKRGEAGLGFRHR